MGYYYSIVLINVLVALAFVPNMAVMLSWIMMGSTGLMFIPMVYNNMFVVPMWALGFLALLPGFLAVYATKYVVNMFIGYMHFRNAKRVGIMNAWVVILVIFAGMVIAAGVYLTHFIATDKDIFVQSVEAFAKSGAKQLGWKGFTPGSSAEQAWERAKVYAEQIASYEIYKALPYPLSAFFFLHWQTGVTAFAFCVVPSILALWAVYHALGNRNYFATDPEAYEDTAIVDGPLFDEDEDKYSSRRESYDDDDDDDESNYSSESVPLSKRHRDAASSVRTVVQDESQSESGRPRRGRVVRRDV